MLGTDGTEPYYGRWPEKFAWRINGRRQSQRPQGIRATLEIEDKADGGGEQTRLMRPRMLRVATTRFAELLKAGPEARVRRIKAQPAGSYLLISELPSR